VKLGDRVTLLVSLSGGGINAVEGGVQGIFATQVKAYDDSAVRMPITLGRELLRSRGAHIWVLGLGDTDSDTEQTVAYLKGQLSSADFEIATWFDLSDFYRKSVVLLSRQIDVVAFLIATIIVFGIANTLMMNVLERTGEIGTMMAMGTRRVTVMRLFVLEGLLLGLLGGTLGVMTAYLLAECISYVGIPMPPPPGRDTGYSAEIKLTVPLMMIGFVVAVVSTALASLYPAWRASRLPIVDALRHSY
jgi:putative ABC transport system permease protein